MSNPATHIPVLRGEVLRVLAPSPGEVYVDCTAGLGGHAAELAPHLGASGTIVLNDVDPGNLIEAERRVRSASGSSCPRVMGVQGNFADLPRRLVELGLRADMVLADLGFSSNQMEDASRGLSFMRDGPLDMRLDPTLGTTASDLVNSLSEVELCKLLSELGEEPGARTIARKVVRVRGGLPITTTEQFADIVRSAVGRPKGKIDSATKSFQALRVAVNDEFGALDALLAQIRSGAEARTKGGGRLDWLTMGPGAKGKVGGKLGARAAIIGFHSLEDRRVKKSFADLAACGLGVLLTKGPIEAQESEVADNPRSRSAKLRAVRISDVTIGAGSV